MTTPNNQTRILWAWQAAEGTAAIIAADSLSYLFGENITAKKWKSPVGRNPINTYNKYSKRNTFIVKKNINVFDELKVEYKPTTAHPFNFILGDPTEDGIDTDIHSIEMLHTGIQTPLTIRMEERGGTNPTHQQVVDSYCTSLITTAIAGQALEAVNGFKFAKLQDIDDYVMLTTDPLKAGGNDVSNCYYLSNVTFDKDGGGEEVLSNTAMIQSQINQSSDELLDGTTDKVRKYVYDTIGLDIHGVFDNDTLWDNWKDRGVIDIEITYTKPNGTDYITCLYQNCNPITDIKEGEVEGGMLSMLHYECEDILVSYTFEGETAFATIFKGALA